MNTDTTNSQTPTELIMQGCEVLGFEFQRAFTIALEAVVLRRRRECNEVQKRFWMSVASDEQKTEAYNDAMAVIQLGINLL